MSSKSTTNASRLVLSGLSPCTSVQLVPPSIWMGGLISKVCALMTKGAKDGVMVRTSAPHVMVKVVGMAVHCCTCWRRHGGCW